MTDKEIKRLLKNSVTVETVERGLLIEKIMLVARRIPIFLSKAEKDYNSLDELKRTTETELFQSVVGIPLNTFVHIVDAKIFNNDYINKCITEIIAYKRRLKIIDKEQHTNHWANFIKYLDAAQTIIEDRFDF